MTHSISIYTPSVPSGSARNMFGKDVANFQLFRAIADYGGLNSIDFLTELSSDDVILKNRLRLENATGVSLQVKSLYDDSSPRRTGTLLRGTAKIAELMWQRYQASGSSAYSIIGLVHTIAPPSIREDIGMTACSPTFGWDALVCTSPSVKSALIDMFDEWGSFIADRSRGATPPTPLLPLIPLGVDATAIARLADNPLQRAKLRMQLNVGDGEILLLWVGRLSYFEKAFPQAMMKAAELAAQRSGQVVHFAFAGWFPAPHVDEPAFREAAARHAPSVRCHFIDGNDTELVGGCWAAADVFVSLVDNIQETFGITPVEAMAAGLPVVVSDWNGYRYTVEHQVQGFLIPTLGAPAGRLGRTLALLHARGQRTYQQYVGITAQHTAVHVGRAADALVALIANPDLRRRMGQAGRERVRNMFDWAVVAPQFIALTQELKQIRDKSDAIHKVPGSNPLRGDPFADFAGFATSTLSMDTIIMLASPAGVSELDLDAMTALDNFAANWRAPLSSAVSVVAALAEGPCTAGDLIAGLPAEHAIFAPMSIVWLVKQGILDWVVP